MDYEARVAELKLEFRRPRPQRCLQAGAGGRRFGICVGPRAAEIRQQVDRRAESARTWIWNPAKWRHGKLDWRCSRRCAHQFGSLNRIRRLVKTFGLVNCTADFTAQPLVINGFSELMAEVFGLTTVSALAAQSARCGSRATWRSKSKRCFKSHPNSEAR